MPIKIKNINDKSAWEAFACQTEPRSFFGSWSWGEFQKKMGNKIWRLGVYDNDILTASALVTKIKAKRGTFLLIQHGPSLSGQAVSDSECRKKIFLALLEELKKIGKNERADFIRISSLWERDLNHEKIVKACGLRDAPMHANAYEATWVLNILKPEEELLANMRKTTRYLIRQTLKNKDITIEKSVNPADLAAYLELNQTVAKKQSFTPFSRDFIQNEFEIFSKENNALLFLGKYRGELAAAALVIFWSGTAYYHQAASGFKHAKLSIPYLIAWEAIKEAKIRNCAFFDFWGYTNPRAKPNHPWAGPTLFKMGFGGQSQEYLRTQDLVLTGKYWLNFLIEKFRKIKKGY
ncbi:MAG: peptidoglycan bridge formation glycyltransferase FemA/FemB family protein [bacterium]|nr:peptidoglycan bridge formation glycyltransferase FemA/FemB family protein [bacterium]